jgi:hypothetical protein
MRKTGEPPATYFLAEVWNQNSLAEPDQDQPAASELAKHQLKYELVMLASAK